MGSGESEKKKEPRVDEMRAGEDMRHSGGAVLALSIAGVRNIR